MAATATTNTFTINVPPGATLTSVHEELNTIGFARGNIFIRTNAEGRVCKTQLSSGPLAYASGSMGGNSELSWVGALRITGTYSGTLRFECRNDTGGDLTVLIDATWDVNE